MERRPTYRRPAGPARARASRRAGRNCLVCARARSAADAAPPPRVSARRSAITTVCQPGGFAAYGDRARKNHGQDRLARDWKFLRGVVCGQKGQREIPGVVLDGQIVSWKLPELVACRRQEQWGASDSASCGREGRSRIPGHGQGRLVRDLAETKGALCGRKEQWGLPRRLGGQMAQFLTGRATRKRCRALVRRA